jgi:hypothetical protein
MVRGFLARHYLNVDSGLFFILGVTASQTVAVFPASWAASALYA